MLIQSVDRALSILLAVAEKEEGYGVRELARAQGLTPPTTQNMLQTLAHHGMVYLDPVSKRYRLGLGAVQLGVGRDPLMILHRLVKPHLDVLRHDLGSHCAAAVWHQGEIVMVDANFDLPDGLNAPFRPYVHHGAHSMALGQVLIAELHTEERERYFQTVASNPNKPYAFDRKAIERNIADYREQGYVLRQPFNDETDKIVAVGIAVSGPHADHCLALGASMRHDGRQAERTAQLLAALRQTADKISSDWCGESA